MIKDSQALNRIRDAVGNYLRREISHGEALEDVVTALEASGRDPFEALEHTGAGPEPRSWTGRRSAGPAGAAKPEPDLRWPELELRA
jgi:hypothetical protein